MTRQVSREQVANTGRRQHLASGCLVTGIVLLVIVVCWPQIGNRVGQASPDELQTYQEAHVRLHDAISVSPVGSLDQQRFDQAHQAAQSAGASMERRRVAQLWMGRTLHALALVMCAIGIGLHLTS